MAAASRKDALRSYFMQVAADLVRRGVLRRQRGQSLEQVIRGELDEVLKEISVDFTAILLEMGVGAAEAGQRVVMRYAENLVGEGLKKLGDLLKR